MGWFPIRSEPSRRFSPPWCRSPSAPSWPCSRRRTVLSSKDVGRARRAVVALAPRAVATGSPDRGAGSSAMGSPLISSVVSAAKTTPFATLTRLAQAVTGSFELSEALDQVADAATALVGDSVARLWAAEGHWLRLRAQA